MSGDVAIATGELGVVVEVVGVGWDAPGLGGSFREEGAATFLVALETAFAFGAAVGMADAAALAFPDFPDSSSRSAQAMPPFHCFPLE